MSYITFRNLTNCIVMGITATALIAPLLLSAQTIQPQTDFGGIGTTFKNFLTFLNTVLTPLVFSLAFLLFIWGLFKFFILSGASEEGRTQGKQLMLWGVIGFVLMVCVWGISNMIASSLRFSGVPLQTVPGISIPPGGGVPGPIGPGPGPGPGGI